MKGRRSDHLSCYITSILNTWISFFWVKGMLCRIDPSKPQDNEIVVSIEIM